MLSFAVARLPVSGLQSDAENENNRTILSADKKRKQRSIIDTKSAL
jgi:hypothetical protein